MTTQDNALPKARKPVDLRALLDNWAMLLAAVSIFVLCALLIDNFLSPLNMRGLGLAISTVGIAACTMLFCLASGHFDLSVGSVIACAGVVAAIVMRDTDSVMLGIGAALGMGLLVGLINGIVIAKLRVNALITTLATMQ
ncbi:ABC transporter permease subunit, partial [Pseudomonas sp. Leaf59]|uniref:ABC transporter permease subunit n=1 Tax=Pseudomonas sp. Leaf59 TaxID=2876556 RepID=UPI003FA692C0